MSNPAIPALNGAGREYGSESYRRLNRINAYAPWHKNETEMRNLQPGERFELHIGSKLFLGTILAKTNGDIVALIDGHQERIGATIWTSGTPVVKTGERVNDEKLGQWLDRFLGRGEESSTNSNEETANMTTEANANAPETASLHEVVGTEGTGTTEAAAPATETKKPLSLKERVAANKAKRAAEARTAKPPKEKHECLCGCGEMVNGRFKMGHDARYHAWLKKFATGLTLEEVNGKSAHAVSRDVVKALQALGGTVTDGKSMAKAATKLLSAH